MLTRLFLAFAQIALFSVGGGYAAMPLIQSIIVDANGWLTLTEFSDLVTLAEMTPGPIALNAATFVGMRLAGVPGALAATLGSITPSLILVTLLSWVYARYRSGKTMRILLSSLRPVVVSLIASAALGLLHTALLTKEGQLSLLFAVMTLGAFALLRVQKWSPLLVLGLCGGAGVVMEGLGLL